MTEDAGHRPVALVPAFKPDSRLPEIARALVASGEFASVFCVNDGSGKTFDPTFQELKETGVHVISHHVNLGKGMALRTGLNAAACAYPTAPGIITFDADGQHRTEDILAVTQSLRTHPKALVLGVRNLPRSAPLRSRFGNALTRRVLQFLTGVKLTDTQTGLRGIPRNMIPSLIRLSSTGYDFELDMLMCARPSGTPILEVPIETIYIENNTSSHFNPLLDSIKIYFVFIRFSSVSIITALLDYAAFAAAFHFGISLLGSLVVGRLFGATFQFCASHTFVFREKGMWLVSGFRYLLVLLVLSSASYFGMLFARNHLEISPFFSKWVVELMIFLISFLLQRDFVFSPGPNTPSGETSVGSNTA